MELLCRLVYIQYFSVYLQNKVPASKSWIRFTIPRPTEHLNNLKITAVSIWELKSKETELLLICKLAELQTTSPLKEHSKIQGLGIHCERVPYLEG